MANRAVVIDERDLPACLAYEGEFGAELILFLPFVTWLSRSGLLRTRRVGTYAGMRCFYDHLECVEIVERPGPRRYVRPRARLACLPVKDEHQFTGRSPVHVFPDLRRQFQECPLPAMIEKAPRPLLVVHNKHIVEWSRRAINHIGLTSLDALFDRLRHAFTIVYIRHGIGGPTAGFSADHGQPLAFDDRAVLANHPEVLCFDDLFEEATAKGYPPDCNLLKNALYSRCWHFISSQGGGAHHCACYSGSVLVVLHRRGKEACLAYGDGYYGCLSDPPPVRVICCDEDELLRVARTLPGTGVADDRVVLGPDAAAAARELSPETFRTRQRRGLDRWVFGR